MDELQRIRAKIERLDSVIRWLKLAQRGLIAAIVVIVAFRLVAA